MPCSRYSALHGSNPNLKKKNSMLEKLSSFRLSGLFLVCWMDGSALEEKSSSKMLRLTFSSKLD